MDILMLEGLRRNWGMVGPGMTLEPRNQHEIAARGLNAGGRSRF